jgi:hypothetical protein
MLASGQSLASRLAEVVMAQLAPCDLGDSIEVVHDVEDAVEIEMECDLDEEPEPEDVACTLRFARLPNDEVGTHQFVRYSAPYDRIELAVEPNAFVRATIEEAKSLLRSRQPS